MTDNIGKLLLVIALVIAVLFGVITGNEKRILKEEVARKENAYVALNAAIEKRIEDSISIYKKPAPELTVDEILKSPVFKTLTAGQRKYYEGLEKERRQLIAAAQAKLTKRDTIVITKYVKEAAGSTDSTVCFARGETVTIQDTTKLLKWKTDITLDAPLKYKTTYTYNPTIDASFKRNKDTKETVVEFKVNDPGLVVQDIQSIVIPADAVNRTRVGQWLYDRRGVFRFVGGMVLFGGGAYVGAKL